MDQRFKYSWQQAVLEAFTEVRPECLPGKINTAQHAISARLCDKPVPDLEEHLALHNAFRSLMKLMADQTTDKKEPTKRELA